MIAEKKDGTSNTSTFSYLFSILREKKIYYVVYINVCANLDLYNLLPLKHLRRRVRVGRGSLREGHWGIWAGAVSSNRSKTPKK